MRKFTHTLFVALVLGCTTAVNAAPMTTTTADKLIQLFDYQSIFKQDRESKKNLFEQQAEQMLKMALQEQELNSTQKKAVTQVAQLMSDLSKNIMNNPQYLTSLRQVYQNTYTEEEGQAYIAFLSSPHGQSIHKKMPQLMQQSMQLNVKLMQDPQFQDTFMTQLSSIIEPLIKEKQAAVKTQPLK